MSPVQALPRVVVEAGGAPIPAGIAAALAEVRVDQALSAPALCELTFLDPVEDVAAVLGPGTELRVGVEGHDEALFAGDVTAVEHVYDPSHGREVRVRGYDRLHRLRKRQAPRVHVQVTPADLATDLVAGDGLAVDAAEPGPVWPRIVQHRQSDLEILLEVCERSGLYPSIAGETLRLLTLEGVGEPVALVLGESLLEARIEANGDPATRSVSAAGWDFGRAESHTASASSARTGREVDVAVPPDAVGGSGERSLLDEPVADDAVALALAQAELDVRIAREVVLRGIAAGDPLLRPGTVVDIANVAPSLAGRYVLAEVRHSVDREGGFVSEISSAPPDPAPRPRGAIATAGVVRSADDPDELGRVQVTLPSFGDVEAGWLEVVSVGAGSGKGLIALPDAGDQVLVMLANEDPARAIVIGGLYGAGGPPDSGLVGGAIRRYSLLTSGGQIIRLDDENNTIRVEDSQGSYVELAPDGVQVHAEANLTIEAPGKNVKIRAASIDFETG